DARRLHVAENERDAFLLFRRSIGAAEDEDPVRILRGRRPGLLAVDDVEITLAFRARLQRGQVGASARLGESLAPPVVEIADARQIFLFLVLAAERDDHRPDHLRAERERLGRWGLLQFLLVDIELHRAPAGAAVFLR